MAIGEYSIVDIGGYSVVNHCWLFYCWLLYVILQLSQPHFEASVKMRLTLPKVRIWSPPGLPRFQSSTIEGKTPLLEVFFILLERP